MLLLRHVARITRVIAPFLLPLFGLYYLTGCASGPATPPTTTETEQAPAPEQTPHVITVPEAYNAISLSVQAGDPDAAIAEYEKAKLENPDDPGTQVLLANLYLIAGQYDSAQSILDTVLAADPQNTDALFIQSLLQAARGDEAGQQATLQKIITIDPDHAQALASLAEIQTEKKSYKDAAANFQKALATEPDNLVAMMGLGNVYLRQEKYEDAEKELSGAIELAPDFDLAYGDRAMARALQYDFSGAESDLAKAIELAPDYYWHYIDRGRVRLQESKFPEAEADFTTALGLNSDLFLGYALRGEARDGQDNLDGAISDYAAALSRRPDYSPDYDRIGILYYMAERFDDAYTYLSRAFKADSKRYDYALLAALSLKSARRDHDATTYLNGIVNTVPRDSLYYEMMRYFLAPSNEGYIMTKLRDATDKIQAGQLYFYLGAQLELLGRIQTAQASFLEAEKRLHPGYVEQRLATWRLRAYRSDQGGAGE